MNHANQVQNYGAAEASRVGAGRALGSSPAPASRIQEALEHLDVAINDLAAAEDNLRSRLAGVMRPMNPPKGDGTVGAGESLASSPYVVQIHATRQRIHNIVASMNDILQRLES